MADLTTTRTERICRSCEWRRERAGDVHIFCARAFDGDTDSWADLMAILGGVGRVPLPGPTKIVDFKPSMKYWPGCGRWPSNFDENIIQDCDGYTAKRVTNV